MRSGHFVTGFGLRPSVASCPRPNPVTESPDHMGRRRARGDPTFGETRRRVSLAMGGFEIVGNGTVVHAEPLVVGYAWILMRNGKGSEDRGRGRSTQYSVASTEYLEPQY